MLRSCSRYLAILLALCAWSIAFLSPTPALAKKTPGAIKLTLQDKNGKRVSLQNLRGQVVVLNFWATWCGPCNAETPILVQAAQQYEGQSVVFLGASVDDAKTQKNIPAFLDRYHVTYPILTGASGDDVEKLKLGIAVPATAFIDANGIIRFRILGQMRPGELQERIEWLLHGHAGPAPVPLVVHLDKNERGN